MTSSAPLAEGTALTAFGPSGGLTIPGGRVLSDGVAVFGYNNYIDPRYPQTARGDNYLFALGFLPYVEISGRFTHYLIDTPPGYRPRDLSANAKVMLPKFFRIQPDIAFGRNDIGGGAPLFRTTYVVAAKDFGLLRATVGRARGEPYLTGFLGSAELKLGDTGFSALVERNNKTSHLGVRFGSKPIASLANATIVGTLQRSFGARSPDGGRFDRPAFGLNLVIPLGEDPRSVRTPEPAVNAVWTPPRNVNHVQPSEQSVAALSNTKSADATLSEQARKPDEFESLRKLREALEESGLERIRVGLVDDRLIAEYENHRYNRNEADAIGIVLALAARLGPQSVTTLSAVTKKAGLALYATTVDRVRYLRFLKDGDRYDAMDDLDVSYRPRDNDKVRWLDSKEGRRGASRVVVEPLLKSFVGTEVGAYDYSLAVSATGFVPLWKGAEGSVTYVRHLRDSDDVESGPFSYAHQRTGLRSAVLNQSFWLTDRLLNVTSLGKLQYDYTGLQNETTLFVPGREDQARLLYSQMRYSDAFLKSTLVNIGAFYRWTYQPLDTWVELGYSKYVENDRGPSVRVSRWFGDVQAQAYVRRSDRGTFAGFQLAFPLTLRQGMRPGYTHIEGPGQYNYGLETKLVTQGDCNCIATARGIAEELPMTYSARKLLNEGRVGRDYLASQLSRMREAALLFTPIE